MKSLITIAVLSLGATLSAQAVIAIEPVGTLLAGERIAGPLVTGPRVFPEVWPIGDPKVVADYRMIPRAEPLIRADLQKTGDTGATVVTHAPEQFIAVYGPGGDMN